MVVTAARHFWWLDRNINKLGKPTLLFLNIQNCQLFFCYALLCWEENWITRNDNTNVTTPSKTSFALFSAIVSYRPTKEDIITKLLQKEKHVVEYTKIKKSKKRNTFRLLARSLLPTKVFGTPPRKSFCLCISLPAGSPVNTSFQMQSAKRLSRLIWNFKLIISVAHDSSPYGANSAQKNPTKRRRPWEEKEEEEDSLKWHHLRYQVKNIVEKRGDIYVRIFFVKA